MGVWQVSSTACLHLPAPSLAVRVLMEDVKTTLFTVLDLEQDVRRFSVPSIAGSIILR